MNLNKRAKTLLYFSRSSVMTDDERAEAIKLRDTHDVNVKIRNGGVPVNGAVEKCEYVAGHVPAEYLRAFQYVTLSDDANATNTIDSAGSGASSAASEATPVASSLAAEVGSVAGGWGNT